MVDRETSVLLELNLAVFWGECTLCTSSLFLLLYIFSENKITIIIKLPYFEDFKVAQRYDQKQETPEMIVAQQHFSKTFILISPEN